MRKKLLILATAVLCSSAAFAGLKQPQPVVVDLVAQTAFGDMLTAANSDNNVEFIGCGSRRIDDGMGFTFRFGFCQASDADGNQITCFTENDNLLDEMRASNDFSFVTFSWEDDGAGNLTCNRVGFSTQSFYIVEVEDPDDDDDDDDDDD
ncbi:MAG: hypothetical protein QNI99_19790 [Woeseiaceae bacterium]|nr:hypothetical protein [Woeseiaceae bacterium]